MEEMTCPNCNVDVDPEELRQNNLRCPTCGFDMSDKSEADQDEDAVLEDDGEDESADDKQQRLGQENDADDRTHIRSGDRGGDARHRD